MTVSCTGFALTFFEYFMFYVLFWKRKMYSVLYGLCPICCLGFFLEYFMYYVLCTFLCTCWLHTPYVYNYIFLGEKIYLPLNVTFQNEEGIDGGLGSARFLYISIGHLLDTWYFRSIKWISRSWWRYLDLLGGGLATQVDSPTQMVIRFCFRCHSGPALPDREILPDASE